MPADKTAAAEDANFIYLHKAYEGMMSKLQQGFISACQLAQQVTPQPKPLPPKTQTLFIFILARRFRSRNVPTQPKL
ncbi:MAG: hypothetical protein AB1513_03455 [Pseudomonadota bacterium]